MTAPGADVAGPRAAVGSDALAAMIDPLNRFYRYPASERLVPWLLPTRITPDQVTAAHALAGVAAAGCVTLGSGPALVAAALLWELHLVLDCLDGVLARARGTASPLGHTRDILADAVAFLALAAAMWGFVRATAPGLPAGTLTFAMIASGALAAWAHDFYLRTFTAALATATDPIYEDLLVKQRALAAGGGLATRFLARFGWTFTWLQVIGLAPGRVRELARRLRTDAPAPAPGESAEARAIAAHAGTPRAARAFRAVSLMSNDNCMTVLGLGLATGWIAAAQLAATIYATVTLVAGVLVCGAFLRSTRA